MCVYIVHQSTPGAYKGNQAKRTKKGGKQRKISPAQQLHSSEPINKIDQRQRLSFHIMPIIIQKGKQKRGFSN